MGTEHTLAAQSPRSAYEEYLHTDVLLSLQKERGAAVNRDELLFQIVHQSSELWLKFAGSEIEETIVSIECLDINGANRLLRRAALGLELITDNLEMLGHLSPWDFQSIRSVLGTGAGFDSPGFRRLHTLGPRLWTAFSALLRDRKVGLVDLYVHRAHAPDLYDLAEGLVEWDSRMVRWRLHHLGVIERMLGEHAFGTQGTPLEILRRRAGLKYFGRLWEVRGQLTQLATK